MTRDTTVAVTGIGLVTAAGPDTESTWAAVREGSRSGCEECVTSKGPPASISDGGHPRRCHARFRRLTGMRRSTAFAPASSAAGVSRSLHELEKIDTLSSPADPSGG